MPASEFHTPRRNQDGTTEPCVSVHWTLCCLATFPHRHRRPLGDETTRNAPRLNKRTKPRTHFPYTRTTPQRLEMPYTTLGTPVMGNPETFRQMDHRALPHLHA